VRGGPIGLPAGPVRVTARRTTHPNGGTRILVRSPFGQRTMPYDHGAHEPLAAAVVVAFGADPATVESSAVYGWAVGTLGARTIRAEAEGDTRRFLVTVLA
jgi:hypothetical protein